MRSCEWVWAYLAKLSLNQWENIGVTFSIANLLLLTVNYYLGTCVRFLRCWIHSLWGKCTRKNRQRRGRKFDQWDNPDRLLWNIQLFLRQITNWFIRIWDLRVIKIILFTSNIQIKKDYWIWDKKFRLEATTISQTSLSELFWHLQEKLQVHHNAKLSVSMSFSVNWPFSCFLLIF